MGRELEEALQRRAEAARALEIEGAALDRERSELREHLALASDERHARDAAAQAADRAAAHATTSRDAMLSPVGWPAGDGSFPARYPAWLIPSKTRNVPLKSGNAITLVA